MRLLVVEDFELLRESMVQRLSEAGYAVEEPDWFCVKLNSEKVQALPAGAFAGGSV